MIWKTLRSEELFEISVRLNDDLGSNLNKTESIAELSDLYKKLISS